jgi:hypothetical protein
MMAWLLHWLFGRPYQLTFEDMRIEHHCVFVYDSWLTEQLGNRYQPYYLCHGCGATKTSLSDR